MISYQIVRFDPSLVASLEPLAHHRNLTSLSLFYSYYFGKCQSKMAELVSFLYSPDSSTRYSNSLHDFYVTFLECNKDFFVNSFFIRTASLWNSLPAVNFPLTYNINGFKSRVNRQGSLYSFFYDFYLIFILFFQGSKKMQTNANRWRGMPHRQINAKVRI